MAEPETSDMVLIRVLDDIDDIACIEIISSDSVDSFALDGVVS